MNPYRTAAAIRVQLVEKRPAREVDLLLGQLPSAIRRMGLVRALEWLAVGKKAPVGRYLVEELAAPLRLHPTIDGSVDELETCARRDLFRTHREALRLFDALATLARIEGKLHAP